MRGCILKRGKTYALVIHLGRDPKTGKKRQKWYSHRTRREAEAHAAQLLVQVQAGGGVPPARMKVGDYFDQWVKDYATGAVAPTSLRRYQDIIRLHIKPALGHIPLSRLTAQGIQSYTSSKLAEGQSPSSVLYHYRVLHEALQHAIRWGLLVRNPTDFVDPPRLSHAEMRTWDEEQVRLFLAEAKRSSRHYTLYLTAILTGMRQGELLGLRWQDIDLTLGTASIRQTFYRLGGQQLFKEPKSRRSRRIVELDPMLVDELRRLRDHQKERRKILGVEYEDCDLVFSQPNGKPLHAQNLARRDFCHITKRAGLPRIRFHDLRHTHATHMLQQGINLKVIQERLGHSNPAFTLAVYSHVLPGMQKEAARLVAERLLGTGTRSVD
jgi:integrase